MYVCMEQGPAIYDEACPAHSIVFVLFPLVCAERITFGVLRSLGIRFAHRADCRSLGFAKAEIQHCDMYRLSRAFFVGCRKEGSEKTDT